MKVQVILKNREVISTFRPFTAIICPPRVTIIGSYSEVCESVKDPVGPTSHWQVFVPGSLLLVP